MGILGCFPFQPKFWKIWKQWQTVQKFPGQVSRNFRNCWISKIPSLQTADVSHHSSPLSKTVLSGDEQGETSAVRRLQNTNHSTENYRNTGAELNGKKTSRKKFSKIWVYLVVRLSLACTQTLFHFFFSFPLALAVNKSPAVYILSHVLNRLWRENGRSVNRLGCPLF